MNSHQTLGTFKPPLDNSMLMNVRRQVNPSSNPVVPYAGEIEIPNDPNDDSKNLKKAKRKRDQKSNPHAKKYAPGGELHDYFFEAAPKWTVGGALRRLLTKVRHNPNSTISIHKFIKDSCKGNLKEYFTQVRNSMNREENMVMADVAYKSFIQLAEGDKPLLRVIPPKHKPRSRAAAVSEEGYAFKDYAIQVTKHGFDLMNAKMVFDDFNEDSQPTRKKNKQSSGHNGSSGNSNVNTGSNGANLSLPPSMEPMQIPMGGLPFPEQFVPNISEQEQEIANNMLLYLKVHIDGLLSTIHHLRTENENFKKEKIERQQINEMLKYELMVLKTQLRLTQQGGEEGEGQAASMMLGLIGSLGDNFPPNDPNSSQNPPEATVATIMGVGSDSSADPRVAYMPFHDYLNPPDGQYGMTSLVQGTTVSCKQETLH